MKESSQEQYGLFVLYPTSEDVETNMDIVFIHGLSGSKDQTWTAKNAVMWPRDLVPKVIPNARVMTYGYDSRYAFSPSKADIKDFALDLLNRLRSKRWSVKALILAQSEHYYTNIFEKTTSILFFGTPHRGSRVASWGNMAANFVNTCTLYTTARKQLLSDLTLNSNILADISTSFRSLASNIAIRSFYETSRMFPLNGLVVEKDSAILGLSTEQCIPMSANHREMVHFTNIESQKFDPVKMALRELNDAKDRNVEDLDSAGNVDKLSNYDSGLLGVVDYDQQLAEIPKPTPGTCEWLALHPSFCEWMRSETSDLLWLRGYPGVGKTVLAKSLILNVVGSPYVRSKRSATPQTIDRSFHRQFLAYFICSENKATLRSQSSVLRSILHQILLGAPFEVVQALMPFKSATVESRGYRFMNSILALWDAIKAALIAVSWDVTYLVVDALDEMTPESCDSFTSGLRDLVDTVSSQIMPRTLKVLITSRPTTIIEHNISSVSISVKSERDVRHFVERNAEILSQRYKLSDKARVEIISHICQKAGSMFLLASLAWDQLCLGTSKESQFLANLKRAEALPANLNTLYETILTRLENHAFSLTMQLLPWLLASTRPLHTNELRFAMVLDTQADYGTICSSMVNEAALKDICPSLITVNERGYVSLAHSSIRDFFFHPQTPTRFRFDPIAVHEKLAVSCLQSLYLPGFDAESTIVYLQSREIRTEDETIDIAAQFYLLAYASVNWHLHARIVGRSSAIWQCFDAFLAQESSVKLWLMLCLYDGSLLAQNGWSFRKHLLPPPSIHIAVMIKNVYLVEMLASERRLHDNGINELNIHWSNSDPKYRKPMFPEEGGVLHFHDLDLDMIKCLIHLGADIGIPNGRSQSPLQLAMHQRNESFAVMLIQCAREKDPSILKKNARMLLEAFDESMPVVLKTILDDECVDLSSPDLLRKERSMMGIYETTPLEHACLFGMETVARTFMTHPRMIQAQLKADKSPTRRNPTGVAFLTTLQGWGDLTCIALRTFSTNIAHDRDWDKRTIVHHAAMEEWHDVLEICIQSLPRSKLNIQDKNGMTALHYAAKMRNWFGTERLLEATADPFMEDNRGQNPAHAAAEAGSDRVLGILLDKGAVSLTHLDQSRRTVLHYAATWNLTSLVESMVERTPDSVKAKDQDGRTVAHMAALFGSTATLSFLLSSHLIDINEADAHGRTLLHCAVESRIASCIDELLSRDGVALSPLDRSLKSPLDLTAFFKDDRHTAAIRETLKEAGCEPGLWRARNRAYGSRSGEEREYEQTTAHKWHHEWQLVVLGAAAPEPGPS